MLDQLRLVEGPAEQVAAHQHHLRLPLHLGAAGQQHPDHQRGHGLDLLHAHLRAQVALDGLLQLGDLDVQLVLHLVEEAVHELPGVEQLQQLLQGHGAPAEGDLGGHDAVDVLADPHDEAVVHLHVEDDGPHHHVLLLRVHGGEGPIVPLDGHERADAGEQALAPRRHGQELDVVLAVRFGGLGCTCSRKDLPFSGTVFRNHNKEP